MDGSGLPLLSFVDALLDLVLPEPHRDVLGQRIDRRIARLPFRLFVAIENIALIFRDLGEDGGVFFVEALPLLDELLDHGPAPWFATRGGSTEQERAQSPPGELESDSVFESLVSRARHASERLQYVAREPPALTAAPAGGNVLGPFYASCSEQFKKKVLGMAGTMIQCAGLAQRIQRP